jgi:hypothetical protein
MDIATQAPEVASLFDFVVFFNELKRRVCEANANVTVTRGCLLCWLDREQACWELDLLLSQSTVS